MRNTHTLQADLVVGADGIHSQVRDLFGDYKPRYMGYRSHRLIMDNVGGVRCFSEYLGRGQRIGVVPISRSGSTSGPPSPCRRTLQGTDLPACSANSPTSRCGACSPRCRRRSR